MYRVLIGNRVIVARHVDIIEEDVNCIGLNDSDSEKENLNSPSPISTLGSSRRSKTNMETQAINDNENENCNQGFNENLENVENEVEEVPDLRRSQRTIKKPSRFDDNYVYSGCIYVNYCSADSPVSFKGAIESDESNF